MLGAERTRRRGLASPWQGCVGRQSVQEDRDNGPLTAENAESAERSCMCAKGGKANFLLCVFRILCCQLRPVRRS